MQSSSALGKVFQDGDAIVRQGEQGDGLYVIQSGEVRVIREEDGREVSLTTLGESDFFGEVPFFERVRDPGVVRSTIRAIGEVHIITIDRKTMVRRIHEDPSLAYKILQTMSRRVRELEEEIIRLVVAEEPE